MADIKNAWQLDAEVNGLANVSKLKKEFADQANSLKTISKETAGLAKSSDKAAASQKDLADNAEGVTSAFGGLKALGVVGLLAGIASAAYSAVSASQDWALSIDDLSNRMSIGLEDATALATSWRLAGVDAGKAESAIDSFQGRLIGELEAQKEISKEIANIEKDRQSVLASMADLEADHLSAVADLEAQRAEISSRGVGERIAQRDKELADLTKDYQAAITEIDKAERQETERLKEEFADRAEAYNKLFVEARADFEDAGRRARNAKEFIEARKELKERQQQISQDFAKEKQKAEQSSQDRVAELRAQREQEKQIFAERAAEIAANADADVRKQQESNARALASLDERIEAEKAAFADAKQANIQQLAELDEAQRQAQEAGGDLIFVMQELGIELFDAEGKMRPVSDLVFEMKERLSEMEDSGRKAAIIADLGWEDLATWINDGASATEALAFAQENNLVPTRETIDAIREQNRLLAEMQLKALGVANGLDVGGNAARLFVGAFDLLEEAISLSISLTQQFVDILVLVWERVNETEWFVSLREGVTGTIESFKEGLEIITSFTEKVTGINDLSLSGIGNSLTGGLLGSLPGFNSGGSFTVGGNGGVDNNLVAFKATRGEQVTITPASASGGKSGSGATVNINAPIYGVADLEATIQRALRMDNMQSVQMGAS